MKLFNVVDGKVVPTDECLRTQPFSDIWLRDTTERKDKASREFDYIEFMVSPLDTNPFYGYPIEDGTRAAKIKENKFKDHPEWEPDVLVINGIEQYHEFKKNASPSLAYYEANLIAAHKVKNFFLTFDINERNEKTNAPIYTVKAITDGIKNADDVLTKLDAMKKKVEQEIFETTKTKGNKKINPFER